MAGNTPDERLAGGRRQWRGWVVGLAISVVGMAVRLAVWRPTNPDMDEAFVPWYRYIATHGGFRALADNFANYNPPYLYLLAAATYIRPALSPAVAIKGIAVLGEFAVAASMYRLVRLRFPTGWMPWVAYAVVLFAPTVILNGTVWGQSDALPTACLLLCVYSACRDRPLATVVWFTVAFAIKLQAVFLGPVLLLLFVERRIPWRYLLAAPIVYVLLLAPAALAGRPWGDLARIYVDQMTWVPENQGAMLTLNAPTIHAFIPNTYYHVAHLAGTLAAGLAGLLLAFSGRWRRGPLDPEGLIRTATLSAALVPFLLPAMHERYFYAADLFSIAQAFYVPSLAPVALGFQLTSGLAYRVFLARQYVPLKRLALLNGILIAFLIWDYWRRLVVTRQPQAVPQPGRGAADHSPALSHAD